ncbi:hypothetical protein [Brucella tritici]|uniref:hypothetical protein n=1 Tax=Brucella tritici TaxID=94626 RepID=UPI0020017002|nr:hypothetical protein [Brucella tritici]
MGTFSTNATLRDCKRHGFSLTAYCNGCHHSKELDIDWLIEKLGPDHGALKKDLAHKLRCSACGAKKVQLLSSQINTYRMGLSKNPWGGT